MFWIDFAVSIFRMWRRVVLSLLAAWSLSVVLVHPIEVLDGQSRHFLQALTLHHHHVDGTVVFDQSHESVSHTAEHDLQNSALIAALRIYNATSAKSAPLSSQDSRLAELLLPPHRRPP
ncbi:hypothetical protein [Variovorax sp. ZT4R33]|uniref:hypothetical protein n=1 Tax=Variovorax sp. ZT4R33 TaxID=3443743 RepID=UPI003F488265